MRKRFVALLGAAAMLAGSCTNVCAGVNIKNIAVSEGKVTVKCVSDTDSTVTYEVYESGKMSDVSNIAALGEGNPSAGEFSIVFGLDRGGSFTFRVHDGVSYDYADFDYADIKDREKFVNDIKDALASADAADALGKIFTDSANKAVMNTVGIDFEVYGAFADELKALVCTTFVRQADGQSIDESAVLNLYNLSKNLSKLNLSVSGAGKEVLGEIDPVFENTVHTKLKKDKKAWVEKAFEKNIPYNSMADIESKYAVVRALCEINGAKTASVLQTLKSYADILNITDDTRYKAYINNANAAANKALVELFAKEPAYNTEDLLKHLAKTADTDDNSGGSGGGGSGGGKTSVKGSSSTVKGNYEVTGSTETKPGDTEVATPQSLFNDMQESHWAYGAVKALKEKGVISGYADGSFAPDRTVTREEFVKMIVTAFSLENADANSYFYDVFDDDWFYPYISAAFEKGIINGNDKGLFGVKADITRQDAAVICARVMKDAGISSEAVREYTAFNDENAISEYALSDVIMLYRSGKINGNGSGGFEPLKPCTRAEAAVMIYGIVR